MKRKIISILSLWLIGLLGWGEAEATVYRLGWWGTPVPNKDFGWNDYAALELVANNNDTVHVYPTPPNWISINVTKPLRFIGMGYLLNVNNGLQFNSFEDPIFNIVFQTGSEGSILQGVTATVDIETNNIVIRYTRLGHLHFNNTSPINNITVLGCCFAYQGYSGHISSGNWANAIVTNLKIVNSYLTSIYLGGTSTGLIANNVFSVDANGVTLDYTNVGNSNFLIKNNIITNSGYWQCYFTSNNGIIKNNLFAFGQGTCPALSGNGNLYGVNMGITFQNWNGGSLSGDSALFIPSGSPAINAGVNNANAATNCGIYGGETNELYQQSGIPPIPAVYSLSTSTQTPTGASMQCTTSVRSNNTNNITRIEYYVDVDPGYGLGTAVTITPGTTITSATFNVPLSGLTEGIHHIIVRASDAVGNWSLNNMFSFVKQYATVPAITTSNVTKLEYYIDSDPGYGLATNIPITAAATVSNITLPINPTLLSEGLHMVYVRSCNANGNWSLTNLWKFIKPYAVVTATTIPTINKLEYYIDTDPGYGLATNIPVTPATDLSNVNIPINTALLTEGMHTASVRSCDLYGQWSLTNVKVFMKPYGVVAAILRPKITRMEYYIDIDPGLGNGVAVAINNDTLIANKGIAVNLSGLNIGQHTIWIRSMDSLGAWSLSNKYDFDLTTAQTASSIVTNSISKYTLCAGDGFKVGYHAKGTFNAGNVFTVQLSNSTGSFASPTTIGTFSSTSNGIISCNLPSHLTSGTSYKIRVNGSNPSLTGIIITDSITIRDRPYTQTITGSSAGNINTAYAYSVPSVAGSTWLWLAPTATIGNNANTASITWSTAGLSKSIKVVQTSVYGCIGDTSTKTVNIYTPAISAAVPSSLSPCGNNTFTITATATGVYSAGNIFTAQLSNSIGSFTSPTTIGTVTVAPSGSNQAISLVATIPNIANGTGYKVRIRSSSPMITGIASVSNITLSNPKMGNDTMISKCPDFTYDLTTLYNASGITYQYYNTSFVLLTTPASVQNGSYYAVGTGSTGCKDTTSITISNFAKPSLGANQVIPKCASASFNLTTVFTDVSLSYQYFTNAYVVVATPSAVQVGTYQIVATNATGCKDTAQITINNNNTPVLGPDTIVSKCPDVTMNLTLLYNTPGISFQYYNSGFVLLATPSAVQNGSYRVVGTSSAGCKDTAIITVSNFTKPSLGDNQVISKCATETYNLTSIFANASWTYQYFTNVYAQVPNPSAVQAGIFQVVATNVTGCKDTVQIVINNNNTPNLGPNQLKYYIANSSVNLVSLFTNPVFSYSYRTYNWSIVSNPSAVTAGVYYIIATYNTCKDTVRITVKLGKGGFFSPIADTAETESDVIVYPNPTSNTLHLVWDNGQEPSDMYLIISDMLGKTIKHLHVSKLIGHQNEAIDVSALVPGMYFLQIQRSNGLHQIVRFVKE